MNRIRPFLHLALLVAGVASDALRADVHVAVAGSDSNPGTAARPFASLERAREAVRALKSAGRIPSHGLNVWLHGGDFPRTNALELTAADSGTEGAPIVWRTERDGGVRLLGGRRLGGFGPVTNAAVLARLAGAARSNVLQADLRGLGVREFGGMKSRGFGRPTTPAHPELFFAGRPMPLARWPNGDAWEHIAGFPEGSGKNDDHGGDIGGLPGGFLYAGDRPRRWQKTGDLWVHGYWAWDWANSYERVTVLDLERRLIRTAEPYGLYGFRKGQRFQFLNVLEELDQPGEWYLDRTAGLLYFWPPSPAGSSDTVLSLLDQPLIRLVDAEHVVIRGLVLEATRSSGVEIRGGADCRVESCVLRNLGNWGVVIEGGRHHGVAGCDVIDTGDGGVSMTGGDRKTLAPAAHYVEDTHFQRQARW